MGKTLLFLTHIMKMRDCQKVFVKEYAAFPE